MTNKQRFLNGEWFRILTIEDFCNKSIQLTYYKYKESLPEHSNISKGFIAKKWTTDTAYYCSIEKMTIKSVHLYWYLFDKKVTKVIHFNQMIFDYAEQCSTN